MCPSRPPPHLRRAWYMFKYTVMYLNVRSKNYFFRTNFEQESNSLLTLALKIHHWAHAWKGLKFVTKVRPTSVRASMKLSSCQLLVLSFVTSFKKDQPSFGLASPKVFSSLSFLINATNSTVEADWKGGCFSKKAFARLKCKQLMFSFGCQSVLCAQVQIFTV